MGGNDNACALEKCTLNKLDPLLGFCNSMLDFECKATTPLSLGGCKGNFDDALESLEIFPCNNESCKAEGMHENDLDVGKILELAWDAKTLGLKSNTGDNKRARNTAGLD